MKIEADQKLIIMTLSALSVILAVESCYVVYMGQAVSDIMIMLWSAVFSLLMAFWTHLDARARDMYEPFEYAYLIFIFWPVILPYHLIKTRGYEGFLMYGGVVGLYLFPLFSALVVWIYFVQ